MLISRPTRGATRRALRPQMRACGLLAATFFGFAIVVSDAAETWRSSLYPEDWHPGWTDSAGRFLHDFSYAGYHYGERPIPTVSGTLVDVTQPPYRADPSGSKDSTAAIQRALDDVGESGGGVVFLPAGTYRVRPPENSHESLLIRFGHIVLRGAGIGKTFLLNDNFRMRAEAVIRIQAPNYVWYPKEELEAQPITADLLRPTTVIPLKDASKFQVGDHVLVRASLTQGFVDEHGCTGQWIVGSNKWGIEGTVFSRIVTAVDYKRHTLTLDAPTRYHLLLRDQPRVHKSSYSPISEVGLEAFSLGMTEHPGLDNTHKPGSTERINDSQTGTKGTMAYDVHGSAGIYCYGVENGWIRNVATYRPGNNRFDVHLLSNGLVLKATRLFTVADCTFERPEYEGGSGNGYLITLEGQEILVRDTVVRHGRHNFDFKSMASCGNVIYHCLTVDGRFPTDFHSYLSVANLFDSTRVEGDQLEACYRPYLDHCQTTTQSVCWNTHGERYALKDRDHPESSGLKKSIVHSQQFGWGYVIGTSGPASGVETGSLKPGKDSADAITGPVDFVEGEARGNTLEPQSLYADQFLRRMGKRP
jgi:hypothetical protein